MKVNWLGWVGLGRVGLGWVGLCQMRWEHYHGAWWFRSCFQFHLNGRYYMKVYIGWVGLGWVGLGWVGLG